MSLPLPKVVADVGPGGPLVTSMKGMNSLSNDMILRQINRIKKEYAPTTAYSEAASKLAYANLMGPQFMAKLMGNDSALANMTEDQKRNALNQVYQAANGGSNGFSLGAPPPMPHPSGVGQPGTNSLSGWLANTLKNAFGHSNRNAMNQQGGGGYDNSNNPGVSAEGPGRIDSGSPFVGREGYKAPPGGPKRPPGGVQLEGEQWYDKNGQPVYDEEIEETPETTDPSMEMELTGGRREPTYAENTGTYKGIVGEGQESGKIRAKDIDQLNTTVFNAETNQTTLDDISDILGSKEFSGIRNTPLLGHHELSYYAKEGTPEQQKMVGRYYTLTGNLIKDASRDFAGQFRKGEQTLLNGMKPGPQDTVDTAKGKTETLSTLNRMLMERSRLTSKLMSQNHINKLEASEMADKMVNGAKIRQEVKDRLSPRVTIRNKTTGETKTISAEEARRLGVPNV